MTREEHLAWAKQRALEYVDRGDNTQAVTSMMSDLAKHKELADHIGINLGVELAYIGALQSEDAVRRWVEGFN
jgi:hypothetical protein